MSSALSSGSSHVGLLARLTPETDTLERSRSKRLFTFVHYEHSSYPRRWIILFFVIIGVTLALGWLIAGLVCLRQTASYLESCAQGEVQCKAGSGLTCSLSSSICLCPDGTYWEKTSSKCKSVKSINDPCQSNGQCDTKNGLICYVGGTCQCSSNTYWTTGGCVAYASFGASCSSSSVPPCNVQLGLQCDSVTQTCSCPSSTYWSYARCEPAVSYTGYCSANATCNQQAGLFCRLPGPYAACDCPLPSKLYTCDCQQGNAWFTASSINGTSACTQLNTYSGNCTSSSQCPQALNLACINGTCDCSVPLWFWSWTSSQCLPCESQGYTLIRYQSQWVCTRLISATLMTYAASRSACTSLGWSLISPIVAADVPVIAQAYPTYRLWMNMQTSLGSSVYTNTLFPTNQSNWNAYVVNSLSPSYSTYLYALQLVSSYSKSMLFEGNTNVDTGHALCALF